MKTLLFVVDKLLYSETEKALSESKAFVVNNHFYLDARWAFGTRNLPKTADTNLA